MANSSRGSAPNVIVFKPLKDRRGFMQVADDSDDDDDNLTAVTIGSGSAGEKKKKSFKTKMWSKDLGNPMARAMLFGGKLGILGGGIQLQGIANEKYTKELAAAHNMLMKAMGGSMVQGRTRGGHVPVSTKIAVLLLTHAYWLFSFYAVCVGALSITNGINPEALKINSPYNWEHSYTIALSVVWGVGALLSLYRESWLAITARWTLILWGIILILDPSIKAGYGADSSTYTYMHRASDFFVALPAGWHLLELVTAPGIINYFQRRESSTNDDEDVV